MTKLEPNKQRAENAIVLIWIVLVLEIIWLMVSPKTVETSDAITETIFLIVLIAEIISAVTFIVWFRRAYSNLHQEVRCLSYTKNWAIYCWFIPILNLYRPYQIMKELYCETEKLLIEKGILSNECPLQLYSLYWWWALSIIGGIIRSIGSEKIITICTLFFGIPYALITIKVIKDYSKLESLLIATDEENNEITISAKENYLNEQKLESAENEIPHSPNKGANHNER